MDDIHHLFANETNEKGIWMEIGPLRKSRGRILSSSSLFLRVLPRTQQTSLARTTPLYNSRV